MKTRKIDIICVSELLIDLIGDDVAESLVQTKSFLKYVGDSPANIAKNWAQLRYKPILIVSIGDNNYGRFIQKELVVSQLNSQFISVKKHRTTSLIKVSRTLGTPEFLAYRQADMCIESNQKIFDYFIELGAKLVCLIKKKMMQRDFFVDDNIYLINKIGN